MRIESHAALIKERDDGFVLLREERDDVRALVAVDVHRNGMDRARALVDLKRDKRGLVVVGGVVLQDREITGPPPAECRDGQIEPAVGVEVRALDVRYARPTLETEGGKRTVFASAEPDHGAVTLIGWQELAEVADQEVEVAIAIEID